jgi:hypothetical protein
MIYEESVFIASLNLRREFLLATALKSEFKKAKSVHVTLS